MLYRIRQQPEPVRYAIFWCLMIAATVILGGVWFLSVRSVVNQVALNPKDAAVDTAANDNQIAHSKLGSLGAFVGERLGVLKDLLPSFEKSPPDTERVHVIK